MYNFSINTPIMDAQTIDERYEAFRRLVASKYPNWPDDLHQALGLTGYHVTLVMKNQRHLKMSKTEITAWAKALDVESSELWYRYGCGYESLSMAEVNEIINQSGKSLDLALMDHAA
jgi:hypothetical protein